MKIKFRQAGFTILELIVVLLIMSVLAINTYINWPASQLSLGAETAQVENDVRYTQTLSMTMGQHYRLVKLSTSTYQIVNSAGTAVPNAQGNTTITLTTGITFGTWTNLTTSLILFDGQGIPYTDTAGTALAATGSIPLTSGSQTQTIQITPQTGRTLIQ